jgi:glycosyltransferase involved in cell wall biosynthesis
MNSSNEKSSWPWTEKCDLSIYSNTVQYPKITIVTPSYNQGQYIEETILSVINQNYPNLEYIIIDGGSTDNSVEIIKKYAPYLAYWVSEKDRGQSDAINKGLTKATGDIFNWLNSDDYYEKNAFYKIASAFIEKKLNCYIGDIGDVKNGKLRSLSVVKSIKENYNQTFLNPVIKQQATFYSMEMVRNFGPLNAQLHYAMDYEWWLKFLLISNLEKTIEVNEYLVNFRDHEESKTVTSRNKFNQDMASILYYLAKVLNDESLLMLFNNVPVDNNYKLAIEDYLILSKKDIISQFICKYLIERHSYIYEEEDFRLMKTLNQNYKKARIKIPEYKNKKISTLADLIPNWFIFKVYRKMKWLLGNK